MNNSYGRVTLFSPRFDFDEKWKKSSFVVTSIYLLSKGWIKKSYCYPLPKILIKCIRWSVRSSFVSWNCSWRLVLRNNGLIYGKLKSAGDGRQKSNRRFSKGRTSLERRNEGQRSVASVFSGRTGLLVGLVVGIWLFRFDGKIADFVEQLHLDVFDPEFGQSTTNNTHKTHKTTPGRKELWDKLNMPWNSTFNDNSENLSRKQPPRTKTLKPENEPATIRAKIHQWIDTQSLIEIKVKEKNVLNIIIKLNVLYQNIYEIIQKFILREIPLMPVMDGQELLLTFVPQTENAVKEALRAAAKRIPVVITPHLKEIAAAPLLFWHCDKSHR